MKTRNFKAMGAAVALLLGMGISSSAQAFILPGTLGASPVATDIITFNCPAGTASVRGAITDAGLPIAAPRVRLGLSGPGVMPVVQSAQEGVSLIVGLVPTGPGTHWAVITKDLLGVENYVVNINCFNAAGGTLGAAGVLVTQNQ
jgi:hypothetical protein